MAQGDLRAVSNNQLEFAKKTMQDIVAKNELGTTASIVFKEGGYPPLTPTTGNYQLLKYYNQVSIEFGFGEVTAVNPRNAGAADVSFTSEYVGWALDGLGMSGADDHTINETGDIGKLPIQAKRAAILMYRLYKDKYKLD